MNKNLYEKFEKELDECLFSDNIALFTKDGRKFKVKVGDITELTFDYLEFTFFYPKTHAQSRKVIDLHEIIEYRMLIRPNKML